MIYLNSPLNNYRFVPYSNNSLTIDELRESDQVWNDAQKDNPTIFNGMQFSCNAMDIQNSNITVLLSKLEYKVQLWAKKLGRNLSGYTAVGVGVTAYDEKKGEFIVMQRGTNVSVYKNQIGSIGGGLDYADEAFNDFPEFLRQAALKEISEEVNVENESALNLQFVCATFDELSSNLVFRFLLKNNVLSLKNDEHTGFIRIPRDELSTFIAQNYDRIAVTTRPSLEYISVLAGQGKI